LFTDALGHVSQAGDPPSPPVGWEAASVTGLGGHSGTQASQAGLQELHGPWMQGRTRWHHWCYLSYSTTSLLLRYHHTVHCTAGIHGKVGQKGHINQQVVLPHADLSSGEWGDTDPVQILLVSTYSQTSLQPGCSFTRRAYIDRMLSGPVHPETILTSLPLITMAKQPSKVNAIMM